MLPICTAYFGNLGRMPRDWIPVAICRSAPRWYRGLRYLPLAPDWDILSEWKRNRDPLRYEREFRRKILSALDPDQVRRDLENLTGGNPAALVCYEKPGEFCHRRLVADWLNESGGFRVGEFGVPDIGGGEDFVNTEVMFSSKTGVWETPTDFFRELDREFHFTLDAAALPENAKCSRFYTPEDDGLKQPWVGNVWCNPPYGGKVIEWVRRGYEASRNGHLAVMLLPARTDTRWFHDYIYRNPNAEIRFVRGRLKFGGSANSAPFPSMVVIFRPVFSGERKFLTFGSENPKRTLRDVWFQSLVGRAEDAEG